MHLEPGVLLLPYNNRWAGWPAGRKACMAGALLVVATAPLPLPFPAGAGLLAGALACAGAGIRFQTWVELLAAPLAFAAAGSVVVAAGAVDRWAAAAGPIVRVYGAASATLLLATTTPLLDLVALFPDRWGAGTLRELFLLSYRAAVAVGEAGLAMVTAVRLRGLGRSWRTAPGVYSAFAGALAVRSLENARRAEAGLAVRGFTQRLPLVAPGESA